MYVLQFHCVFIGYFVTYIIISTSQFPCDFQIFINQKLTVMKKKFPFAVLFMFLLSLVSSSLISQNETQMILSFEDNVKANKVIQYEEVAKKQIALLKKYDFKFPFGVYVTDDNYYLWNTPIENLGAADDVIEELGKFETNLKENNEIDLQKAYKDLYNSMMIRTIVFSPALSYIPDEPRLKDEEAVYQRIFYCYLYPGENMEFYNKNIQYVKYFKEANVNSGFKTFYGALGWEMPLIIYVESYKNEMDLLTTREEIFKEIDPKISELWQDMQQHIKRMETKICLYRPDLSYIPEN
jgi:hypothetical protein